MILPYLVTFSCNLNGDAILPQTGAHLCLKGTLSQKWNGRLLFYESYPYRYCPKNM